MAKRASLKKTKATTTSKVGEGLSIEKQEEIVQKANLTSVRSKRGNMDPFKRVTFDIPIDLYHKMKELKYEKGITSKGLLVSLLRDHFAE